jgi:hypothetical protein
MQHLQSARNDRYPVRVHLDADGGPVRPAGLDPTLDPPGTL